MACTSPQLISRARLSGIIPVFSHEDPEVAYSVLKACYSGGIRVFEFTNRTVNALDVFSHLISRKKDFPELVLGAGTVMDANQCDDFINAGADFIVAPIIDMEVAERCRKAAISWTPGCGTLTEIITAERLGAGLIKVFPADVLGPDFIRAVLGPCPWLHLMPTGGVTPEKANLQQWFSAGVVCVGMGSKLISPEILRNKDFANLESLISQAVQRAHELR